MKLKFFFLFITMLFIPKFYSQEIEYHVLMIGKPQEIFLKKDLNNNYSGKIITKFYKPSKYFLGITLRKYSEIEIKTNLDSTIVKETINDLNKAGINSLEKFDSNEECKSIKFLDSDFLVFKINTQNSSETFEFSEVYPEELNSNNIEKNFIRRKAQILITLIDNKINLKEQFRIAEKNISNPYCYSCGGISSCCIE